MESKYTNGQIKRIIVYFFLFLLLLPGCTNHTTETTGISIDQDIFENGDIICRLGNGFFSNRFKEYSKEEKIYSHTGIIEVKNDSVFVLHADASELTGIGFVKRENIQTFLHNIHTWGLYRLAAEDSVQNKIVKQAVFYHDRRTPFDLDFDISNDDKVYCTQLIALSVNKALDDDVIKPGLVIRQKQFYGVDDIYLIPQMKTIYKTVSKK